jgi:hypothetical protein
VIFPSSLWELFQAHPAWKPKSSGGVSKAAVDLDTPTTIQQQRWEEKPNLFALTLPLTVNSFSSVYVGEGMRFAMGSISLMLLMGRGYERMFI